MPNEDAVSGDDKRRQALRLEAMLDMFEEDRGRSAASMEELSDWMGAQYLDRLQLRMDQRRPRPSPGPGRRAQSPCSVPPGSR